MKAAELRKRYAAGERDFRGANLRGQSFKGQDLSGADFSGADIRSADFSRATLCGANFSSAKAGLQRRWAIMLVLVSWILAGTFGFFSGLAGYLVSLIFSDTSSDVMAGWVSLIGLALLITVIVRKGTGTFAFVVAFAVVFVSAFASAFVFAVAFGGTVTFAVVVAVVGAVVVAGAVAGAVAVVVAVVVAGAGTVAAAAAGIVAFVAAVVVAVADKVIVTGAVAVSIVSAYIGWRALGGDPRDAWIRSVAIGVSALGGTSFRHAALRGVTFTYATLKSTDLRGATLTLTNWHQARKLDRARVGETILLNSKVRELAVTHRGAGQSYKGLDLRGAHLAGADLSDADLTEADISNATLEGAWLERANLTKTQMLGTNFHQAHLTGACLEEWNIGSTTRLEGVICEYIYLLNGRKERRPSSGTFAPGEFAKLFEEVLDTIDLIFRNGVDWKALVTSFQQVQVENDGVELSIQSIENKGDGVVVVRVNAPPEANKEKIHSDFNHTYEAELAVLKAEYQAKLEAKDEQIAIYREKSADMKEIVSLLASRPVTHAETYIHQVDAMSQTPGGISQTITHSPNSNINAVQGNQNPIDQTQGAPASLSQAEVVEMLARIQALIAAADLPGEVKVAATTSLKTAQKATEREQPRTEIALDSLESMAETLETASKTVAAGKTLWEVVKPILVKVGGWLGAAVGSALLG